MTDTLLHIEEELSEQQQRNLLLSFGNKPGAVESHFHSAKPHLLFVSYDQEELCPHDLVAIARGSGIHAHLVDF